MESSLFRLTLWGVGVMTLLGLSSCQGSQATASTNPPTNQPAQQSQVVASSVKAEQKSEPSATNSADTAMIAWWERPKLKKINPQSIDSIVRRREVILARTGDRVAKQRLEVRLRFPKEAKLRNAICELTWGDPTAKAYRHLGYTQAVNKMIDKYWSAILKDIRKVYPPNTKLDSEEPENLNFYDYSDTDIIYMDNQLVSGTEYYSRYTTESLPYGETAISGFTLLKETSKQITLDDIFTPDYTPVLGKLLLADLLKQYEARSADELREQNYLTYDGTKLPDGSFYLTDKGLYYLVNPGIIGGMSLYDINMFVPYEALKPILKPDTFVRQYLK